MDIALASTEADLAAVEAIKDHHAAMAGALGSGVSAVQQAARSGQGLTAARDAVVAWSRDVLLPHAAAEEQTIYAAAGAQIEGRLLMEALVADHGVITELVNRLANADDAVTVASAAASLEALFLSHLAKENEQVLPFLAADPSVSLSELLGGMHHELAGDRRVGTVPQESGCDGNCSCGEPSTTEVTNR